ncbi:hypothetical protein LINGRAHAP2_LOCUS19007 [Linum grandiflorum]
MASFSMIFVLISIATTACSSNTGYAQKDLPEQLISKASSSCFHDKVYDRCNRAYRLSLSGDINVPAEATDVFCNGPCLDETRHVLDCVDDLFSDFVFFNRAMVKDVRRVLSSACSSTSSRRGSDFDVSSYLRDETSGGGRQLVSWVGFCGVVLISWSLLLQLMM